MGQRRCEQLRYAAAAAAGFIGALALLGWLTGVAVLAQGLAPSGTGISLPGTLSSLPLGLGPIPCT